MAVLYHVQGAEGRNIAGREKCAFAGTDLVVLRKEKCKGTFMWKRLTVLAGLMCVMSAGTAWAQEQELPSMPLDAKPVYEVATIKPSDPAGRNQGFQIRGQHVKVTRQDVETMMMFAYGVHAKQIVNAPDWAKSDRFDVDGVPDVKGEPNLKQMQSIVQDLLETRFGLKFHREKREMTAYVVRVEKGGAKIEKSKSDPLRPPDQSGNGSGGHKQFMKFTNNSLNDFAFGMQYFMDKPVVNQTGLDGRYDFELTWNPNPDVASETTEADVPGIFTAMKEQIGLRMDTEKTQVDVLVVDAVSKPSEN